MIQHLLTVPTRQTSVLLLILTVATVQYCTRLLLVAARATSSIVMINRVVFLTTQGVARRDFVVWGERGQLGDFGCFLRVVQLRKKVDGRWLKKRELLH